MYLAVLGTWLKQLKSYVSTLYLLILSIVNQCIDAVVVYNVVNSRQQLHKK